jgi:hypothetical protein
MGISAGSTRNQAPWSGPRRDRTRSGAPRAGLLDSVTDVT